MGFGWVDCVGVVACRVVCGGEGAMVGWGGIVGWSRAMGVSGWSDGSFI